MARANIAIKNKERTYEGAKAEPHQSAKLELLRAVSSCLLFENTFYEKGVNIAERIANLSQAVPAEYLGQLAIHCRQNLNLRHVSLWLAVQLMRHPNPGNVDKAAVVEGVIRRADELAEIIALYWVQNPASRTLPSGFEKHTALAGALRRGIARAFEGERFKEYHLAKYDRKNAVRLRDALFLSHAKPQSEDQDALWKRLIAGELATPLTWETELSAGADKGETFTRLIEERKIGYQALVRNLRNMDAAKVDRSLVTTALKAGAERSKLLPFQFVAAWRFAPAFAAALDDAMLLALSANKPKLAGTTMVVVDVSQSMEGKLSDKSQMDRLDAAAALAVICREGCEDVRFFTFSNGVCEVQATRGLGLVSGIRDSQPHMGTALGESVDIVAKHVGAWDRMIVITDEQAGDHVPVLPRGKNYLVNVASYKPALPAERAGWTRINGFSERLIEFIAWNEEIENENQASGENDR